MEKYEKTLIGILFLLLLFLLLPENLTGKVQQVFVEDKKVCYLTFDDGPSENTEKVLDILKKYNIKATFFVVGREVTPKRAQIIRRMKEEGHEIGIHANEHVYEKLYASEESFFKDYETLYVTLVKQYDLQPTLFRFPGGSRCNCLNGKGKEYIQKMKEKGFTCFDWNVSGEDAVGSPTVESIQKNVLKRGLGCRRAIVLLHDSNMAGKTVEALPGIIEKFLEEGFAFDTLENTEGYVFPASR
jgi:peptidoglycan/xylan/chitin deacetylase (PgdA/CDA1 family)